MKKKFWIAAALILCLILPLAASCSGGTESGTYDNERELAKLPEDFPLAQCPLYACSEIVSITSKSDKYISYEVTFNSYGTYEETIAYYKNAFPKVIEKDFGIAYLVMSVPEKYSTETEKYFMCNFNICSDVTKGSEGCCTVIVTVSEY